MTPAPFNDRYTSHSTSSLILSNALVKFKIYPSDHKFDSSKPVCIIQDPSRPLIFFHPDVSFLENFIYQTWHQLIRKYWGSVFSVLLKYLGPLICETRLLVFLRENARSYLFLSSLKHTSIVSIPQICNTFTYVWNIRKLELVHIMYAKFSFVCLISFLSGHARAKIKISMLWYKFARSLAVCKA